LKTELAGSEHQNSETDLQEQKQIFVRFCLFWRFSPIIGTLPVI
jgi:hypothetical protein